MHPAGVGEAPGVLRWREEDGNPGNALLGADGTRAVPVVTLDGFAEQHGLTRIDFIKVDVEGMELSVFRGARRCLERFRPVIYFETLSRFSRGHDGNNSALIAELLTAECRYQLHRLYGDGRTRPVRNCEFGDYTLAVPAERAAAQA